MKNVLSSVGIGAATVDTVLPKTTFTPGETTEVSVEVEGGSTEQEIDDIYFALLTKYRTEEGYETGVVDRFKAAESFTIGEDEHRSFPVEVTIPPSTPVTRGGPDVYLKTGLDIDWAIDPKDKDYIEVEPTPEMETLFAAAEDLDLRFHKSECEKAAYGTSQPFLQEFEFRPSGGEFHGQVDEVEFVCVPRGDSLDVRVEIDRRGGLLAEVTDTDERRTTVSVHADDAHADVADRLRRTIQQHS